MKNRRDLYQYCCTIKRCRNLSPFFVLFVLLLLARLEISSNFIENSKIFRQIVKYSFIGKNIGENRQNIRLKIFSVRFLLFHGDSGYHRRSQRTQFDKAATTSRKHMSAKGFAGVFRRRFEWATRLAPIVASIER